MSSKISALPAAATLTGAELVPLVQSAANVKSTVLAQAAATYLGISNSGNITLNNSTTAYVWTHGLGRNPGAIRAVLVCISNDANLGTVIGDEISVESIQTDGGAVVAGSLPVFAIYSNTTAVTASCAETLVGAEGDFMITKKLGGATVSPSSFNNFALKIYAI